MIDNPTPQEVLDLINYVCKQATQRIKDMLHELNGDIKNTGIRCSVSSYEVSDIKNNRRVVVDPRMAVRILQSNVETKEEAKEAEPPYPNPTPK